MTTIDETGSERVSRRSVLATGAAGVATSTVGCIDRLTGQLETFEGSVDVDPALATDESPWAVVHGDSANTRSVPADAMPEQPLSLEWTDAFETIAGHVHPVARDGVVIGSDLERKLYALDAETGDRTWTVTESDFEPSTVPILTDDAVLIGTRSALWAFDQDGGDERWRTDESVSLSGLGPHPTADDDRAYVPTPLGLAAHDLESGERQWERRIGLRSDGAPAIRDETVYLGGGDATLHALERSSGDVRWRANADGEIGAGPTVTDVGIFVGTDAGTVIAYDHDGRERWRTAVSDRPAETLAVGNGVICAATDDDALTVVDPATGDRVWRSERYVSSYANGPVVGDGRIVATVGGGAQYSRDEKLGVFDAETGELEWESGETGIKNGPAVVDGAVYLTGYLGEASALAKFS